MISRENILALETRRRIYDFIEKNPGLHLREISRKIDISFGGLRHHLDFLEKQGLIITKSNRRYIRYFAAKQVGEKDKEILNLLRQETPLRIIMLLLIPGPSHIYKDEQTQKKAFSEHDTFLKTYSKKELLELTRFWNGPYGKFFHLHKHRTTIDFHLKKLLDVGLIDKVKVGRAVKYKLKDEDIIWTFFIKYQGTLSSRSLNIMMEWQNEGLVDVFDKMTDVFFEIFPHPYYG